MTGDRLTSAFRRSVHRVLGDDTKNAPINYGHLHAARYLEERGEKDPFILAEHHRRGEDPLLALRRA